MTIDELIKDLKKYPGDLEVLTEGCDCIGDVVSSRLDEHWPGDEHPEVRSVVILERGYGD
jgi:hypothetical protein